MCKRDQIRGSCGETSKRSQNGSYPVPRDDTAFVKDGVWANQIKHKAEETFLG